jgi:tetratricopeptide (TPR) repeat protein
MSGIAIGLFFLLGFVLSFAGYIWGLVLAFQQETVWGLLYFFIPCAGFVFHVKYWSNLKIRKAFLVQCGGLLMFLLGGLTTYVFYGKYFKPISQSGINGQQGANEQSPSSFPSDFNTSPSPIQQPSPTADATPGAEPNFGTVGGQQYDFNKSIQLGKLAYKKGDYQTALINYNRAVQANPGDAEALKGVEDTKKAIAQAKTK